MSYTKLQVRNFSNNSIAILWMIIAAFTLSLNISVTKILIHQYSPIWIFFVKNFLVAAFLLPTKLFSSTQEKIKIFSLPPLYYVRAIILTVSFICWYYSLKYVSIIEATCITYLTPVLNLLAGSWVFKEKINFSRSLSIGLAFIGMFIILQPSLKEFNLWIYIMIGIAIMWSIIDIICKIQVKTEKITDLILYNAILVLALSAPYCLSQDYPNFSLKSCIILIIVAIVQITNLCSFFKAYQCGELTVIIPVDFLKIVFSLIISWILFERNINPIDLIGSIFLICSAISLFYKEKI